MARAPLRLPIKVGTSASSPNIKIPTACCRRSPLYEWRRGKYQLVQELDHDDGAHGACLFEATNGKLYLAIACCGDREKKSYKRNSPVYEISLDEDVVVRRKKSLPTTGAVAFALSIWGADLPRGRERAGRATGGQRRVGRLGGDVTHGERRRCGRDAAIDAPPCD